LFVDPLLAASVVDVDRPAAGCAVRIERRADASRSCVIVMRKPKPSAPLLASLALITCSRLQVSP